MNAGRAIFAVLCLSILVLVLVPQVGHTQVYKEAQPMPLDLKPLEFRDRGDGVYWEARIVARGALYLRVHFVDIVSPAQVRYQVVVRDGDEHFLASYDASEFGRGREFQTGILFTSSLRVQVQSDRAPTGLTFRIDQALRQVDLLGRMTPQSFFPAWKDLTVLKPPNPAIALATSVAKLYIGDGYVCTAFLVSDKVLLTAEHCLEHSNVWSRDGTDACNDIQVQFDFDAQPSPSSSVSTSCVRVLDADGPLDYALLEVKPEKIVRLDKKPRPVFTLSQTPLPREQNVMVIHHPAGLAKKVSVDCTLFPKADDLLEHDCSTVGGSSGAPILSENNVVLGLHVDGPFPEDMTIGEISRGLASGKVYRNKARPIHLVRERIRGLLP